MKKGMETKSNELMKKGMDAKSNETICVTRYASARRAAVGGDWRHLFEDTLGCHLPQACDEIFFIDLN